MAKKGQRILVKMRSTESGHIYITEKSRRNTQGRLELRKYDPYLRKHVRVPRNQVDLRRVLVYSRSGDAQITEGYSSVGRATVSKTVGREFESFCPCRKFTNTVLSGGV